MSYKNFPLVIFWYSPAVMALDHCAKIHSLSSRNKLPIEVGVLGLSRFLADCRVSERPKVCAFISQKLNKPGRPFFTFFDILCRSIRNWNNIPSGVKVRGRVYSAPKTLPEAKISKFSLLARPLCAYALSQLHRTSFILHLTWPASERPVRIRRRPFIFWP